LQVLTTRECAAVIAIAEAFFPAREPIGVGGEAAGAVTYVDTLLARLPLPKRIQMRGLLVVFEVGTAITNRGALFSAAPFDERVARLQKWERADRYTQRALYSALRWLFTLAYLADPEVQRRIGLPEAGAHPPGPLRGRGKPARLRNGPRVRRLERLFNTDQLITGIEIPRWLRILAGARFRVSARYLHRVAWISGWSVGATAVGAIERRRYDRRIASTPVDPPPIFVLGHWRSGTTHLHNLLGRDPDNTYPTVYQVVFPTAFMLTSSTIPPLTARMLSDTRGYDNVAQGWNEAAEDEIALAKLTGLSPYLAFMLPDQLPHYERYFDFLQAREAERDEWKAALRWFIGKIRLHSGGRRPVIKSCAHMARIRMLLDVFPDAKFVHIHRNPFTVAASTIHMREQTDWENFLQVPEKAFVENLATQVMVVGQRLFEQFFEDRSLIPPENFIEIAYPDLVARPREVLDNLYRHLDIPQGDRYDATIGAYLDGLRGYQTNKLSIDDELADLIRESWKFVFEEYGYSLDHRS
jgi:hypothetical protein